MTLPCMVRPLSEGREKRFDRGLGLGLVTAAEQIGVVELVVQVVEPLTVPVPGRPRPGRFITGKERRRESTEQGCHRQIHLPIGMVHGRIEKSAAAIAQDAAVARPQIAVNQRGQRVMLRQPHRHLLEQSLSAHQGMAPARGPVQLRGQPAVPEESGPVRAPAVALGGGTDPVVLIPAEGTAHFATAAMQLRQRHPEPMPGLIAAW